MKELSKPMEYTVLSHRKGSLICEFILGDRFLSKTECSTNYHFHSAYELHICVRGSARVMIEDDTFVLEPHDLCILPPGTVHYVSLDGDACSMGFRFRLLWNGRNGCGEEDWLLRAFSELDGSRILRQSEVLERYLSHASQNMKENGSPFVTASLLFLSLHDLAGDLWGNSEHAWEEGEHAADVAIAEEIETYVNSNYHRKISLSDIAAHLNLGCRQTERRVKQLFDMTWGELLCRKRLAVAGFLLRTTAKGLDEIAADCGFEDKSYFCRRFAASFGLSPGKYREACRAAK